LRFLEENHAVFPLTRLWAGRSQGSNSDKDDSFLCPTKRPDWLLVSQTFWAVCNVLLQRGKCGRGRSLTTHLYRVARCWCSVQSIYWCYVSS